MHCCFRIIQVSTFLWLQEIYIVDACVEHIKYTADIFSIRRFQTIWIKKGVVNGSQTCSSKEQLKHVC